MKSSPDMSAPQRHYNVISGDGHLEIPPEDWFPWVSKKFQDRAPRIVKDVDGADCYSMENLPLSPLGGELTCGDDPKHLKRIGNNYHEADGVTRRVGLGDAVQRLHEMDADGIDAEVLFPPFFVSAVLRKIDDDDAYLAMVQGYNSWLAEGYCSVAPDRLIGVAVTPMSNLTDAIAELRRCKSLGLRCIALHNWPSGGGRYTPEDDCFFETLLEEDMRLTPHMSFGDAFPSVSQKIVRGLTSFKEIEGPENPDRKYYAFRTRADRADTAGNILELIISGVFDRFPELKVYFAESHAYWVPDWLDFSEDCYYATRHWYDAHLSRRIREYVQDSVLFGFVKGPYDAQRSHSWDGEKNIVWGSDLPHSSATFPFSEHYIERAFEGESTTLRQLVLRDTIADFLGLDLNKLITPTPPGGPYEHPCVMQTPPIYKANGKYLPAFD